MELRDLIFLCRKQKQFLPHCRDVLIDNNSAGWLLVEFPEAEKFLPEYIINSMGGYGWSELLSARPEFAERCNWEKLNGSDWVRLLMSQGMFANKCNWSKLDGCDWFNLLSDNPEFAKYCDWDKLDSGCFMQLLYHQPQFIENCPEEKRDFGAGVLIDHPELAKYLDFSKFNMLTVQIYSPNFTIWKILFNHVGKMSSTTANF